MKNITVPRIALFIALGQIFLLISRPGDLDTSFGAGGKVVTEINTVPVGNHAIINGLVIHENNIIAVGNTTELTFSAAPMGITARYHDNGTLDTTFSSTGYIINRNTLYNAATLTAPPGYSCVALLAAGGLYFLPNTVVTRQFHVGARGMIPPNCTISFRNDAQLLFPSSLNSEARAIALDSQRRIVVGGFVVDTTGARRFGLAKTSFNGFLNVPFGPGGSGFVTTPISDTPNDIEQINAVVVASDDSIVVAGQALINTEKRFIVARYTRDGELDTAFNSQGPRAGIIIVDFAFATQATTRDDSAQGLVIQRDGKIVVTGYVRNSTGTSSVALARFTPEGSLDDTFGNSGVMVNLFDSISAQAQAITQQQNGSLVLAGTVRAPFANDPAKTGQQFMVVRYLPDGILDTSFGNNGHVYTGFNNKGVVARAIVLDQNENIVVGGYNFTDNAATQLALARYISS